MFEEEEGQTDWLLRQIYHMFGAFICWEQSYQINLTEFSSYLAIFLKILILKSLQQQTRYFAEIFTEKGKQTNNFFENFADFQFWNQPCIKE